MRVPLIATLEYSVPETNPFPALDGVGRIPFSDKDGEPATFQVDEIGCVDFLSSGKVETNFWLDGIPTGGCSVHVTDQRVVVYSKYIMGLFGKTKVKNGKASAGHLYYGSISNISAFIRGGMPTLVIVCYRKDGTRTAFTVKASDLALMKKLAFELHDRIDYWIVSQGRKISETNSNEKWMVALKKWNEFQDHAWVGDEECSVLVPCASWDQVADGRMSG